MKVLIKDSDGKLIAALFDTVSDVFKTKGIEAFIAEDGTRYNINKRTFEPLWMSPEVFEQTWSDKAEKSVASRIDPVFKNEMKIETVKGEF